MNADLDTIDAEIAKPRYPFNSPTVGATTTLDLSLARSFVFTVSQATTISITNTPSASFYVPVELIVTNGSAFAITWPASVSWLGGIAPTFKAAGVDVVDLATKDAGVTWLATLRNLRPGVLFQSGQVSTTSTTDVSLASYTLPASVLAVSGQMLRITVNGDAITQNATTNIRFGATQLSGHTVTLGRTHRMFGLLTRITATTQAFDETFLMGDSVAGDFAGTMGRTSPGETLSGTVVIDFRGSVVAGGTLRYYSILIELLAIA